MIPSLSSSTTNKVERPNGVHTSSITTSDSDSLEFAIDNQPPWQDNSPTLLRSGFLKLGNEMMVQERDFGTTSSFLEKRHSRSGKDSNNISRSSSPKVRRSVIGSVPGQRPNSALSSHQSSPSARRHRVANQETAANSLSLLESEFQKLVQKQSQLSTHKVELCKELISLYSRRNINEKKQEEAAKLEHFEEADSAATTIQLVKERIQKLEKIYLDTDQSLWKYKKRQDELGRSISEMHQAVMQEMDQMRQAREREQAEYQVEAEKMRKKEIERIQSEREEVDKEKSDIALGKDFLEKNEAELLERMEEETKVEQEELNVLNEKQIATRAEIQELTKKLEQLNNQDREYSRGIEVLARKIRTIAQQFDGNAKEVAQEKRELERRTTDIQRKVSKLDQQESNLHKTIQDANAVQDGVRSEIQQISSQQNRLEQVRRLFEEELTSIQRLRLEEEAFREKEVGWNMRSSSLSEDLRSLEAKIESLTSATVADQKVITDLELDLEAAQKRINTIESLKALSVQRRDFKQASHCSNELIACRDTIGKKQSELEKLKAKKGKDTNEELETLQKEYEKTKAFVISEEANLFKEIQESTTEILARLEGFPISLSSGADEEKESTTDDISSGSLASKTESNSAVGQLTQLLLNELKSEIEGVQEMSRIRYGREETIPLESNHGSDKDPSIETTDPVLNTNGSKEGSSTEASTEEQRHVLEQDIQAAVALEDYDAAGEFEVL
ncbi:hypothetical protein BGZ46_007514 [Entomortierella lignicola]|nr:hypothetical protein BGZ46_007514 [Entomortierella lignicola]